MRIITIACLLAFSVANADDLVCDGCVHTDDIRGQAVTTQKIMKEAVTEGKLSPDVRRKINGFVVTDGVGRKLPIEITHVTALTAHGYYRMENGEVIPIVIEENLYSDLPPQILSNTGQGSGPWPYSRFSINGISFTAAGCTGQPFIYSDIRTHGDTAGDFLFRHFLIADPDAPNRSRLIYRIEGNVEGYLSVESSLSGNGCFDSSPYFGSGTNNGIAVSQVGTIRWVPPLSIELL